MIFIRIIKPVLSYFYAQLEIHLISMSIALN